MIGACSLADLATQAGSFEEASYSLCSPGLTRIEGIHDIGRVRHEIVSDSQTMSSSATYQGRPTLDYTQECEVLLSAIPPGQASHTSTDEAAVCTKLIFNPNLSLCSDEEGTLQSIASLSRCLKWAARRW
jgi:hypothetical protein